MRKVWKPHEDDRLRNLYTQAPAEVVANILGCTVQQVCRRARRIGLRQPTAVRSEISRQRMLDPHHPARHTRFQRGQTPWNKGTRFVSGGRSAETRFKPGRLAAEAANYLPIGTTRVNHGYLMRKVTDDPALFPATRWEPEHRLVWIAAHGDIPAGHVVAFRPGLHTLVESEITLDRLELISRAENGRRNRGHHYPPELKEAIRTLRQLRRTIQEAQS